MERGFGTGLEILQKREASTFSRGSPRCALIGGMHEISNADWRDARVTWHLTPLSFVGSLALTRGDVTPDKTRICDIDLSSLLISVQ